MALGEKNLFLSFLLEPPLLELRKLKFDKFDPLELALDTFEALDPLLFILFAEALD